MLLILKEHQNDTSIFGSAIVHLPECFCPMAFFWSIELSKLLSNYFYVNFIFSPRVFYKEFQTLQLIVRTMFGAVD